MSNNTEKKALIASSSLDAIMEAFRLTNPKELEIKIEDSVGQKPQVNWFRIGTIVHGGSGTTVLLKGTCDIEFGIEHFSRFKARYDTQLKSGTITLFVA